jgi:hypothetical protein
MKRQKVGIIITDQGYGDLCCQVCSEEDYNTIISYHPKKIWNSMYGDEEILDVDKFIKFVQDYFFDKEKEDNNEKVIQMFFTQIYVPEKVNLEKYEIIGILTLPGG